MRAQTRSWAQAARGVLRSSSGCGLPGSAVVAAVAHTALRPIPAPSQGPMAVLQTIAAAPDPWLTALAGPAFALISASWSRWHRLLPSAAAAQRRTADQEHALHDAALTRWKMLRDRC